MGESKLRSESLEPLYHYCSQEVFELIIRSRSLRCTDIKTTNDPLELRVGQVHLKEAVDSLLNTSNDSRIQDIILEISKNIESFAGDILSCLVSCLSRKHDFPVMWEEYAVHGSGLCIGFHPAALSKIPDTRLVDVRYVDDDAKSIVNKIVDEISKEIQQNDYNYNLIEGNHKTIEFMLCMADILHVMVTLKDTKWYLEDEVRLVYPRLTAFLDTFTNRRNTVVRYCDVPFGRHLNFNKQIVDHSRSVLSATVGPRCVLSEKDVHSFLRANGYYGFRVCASKPR